VEVGGLFFTGNVLLVFGSEKFEAWLVTGEEPPVNRAFYKNWADRRKSLWTVASHYGGRPNTFEAEAEGQMVAIGRNRWHPPFIYNIKTGRALSSRDHRPQSFGPPYQNFGPPYLFSQISGSQGYFNLRHHFLPQPFNFELPETGGWLIPHEGMPGWVIDPKGRSQFWLPAEWRESSIRERWHHDITTLFNSAGEQPFIIKF
jgi:hypothetical protein